MAPREPLGPSSARRPGGADGCCAVEALEPAHREVAASDLGEVVDEDIDIRDMNDVNRAIRDRLDPKDDIVVFPGMGGSTLDPSAPSELRDEMKYGATPQNKVLFDATIDWVKHPIREDYGGRRLPPPSTEMSPEIVDLVKRRWKEYGF